MCTLHLEEEQVTVIQEACTCYTKEQCNAANPADASAVADDATNDAASDDSATDDAVSDGAVTDEAATDGTASDTSSNDTNDNSNRDRGLGKSSNEN